MRGLLAAFILFRHGLVRIRRFAALFSVSIEALAHLSGWQPATGMRRECGQAGVKSWPRHVRSRFELVANPKDAMKGQLALCRETPKAAIAR
jgi:hypothetical protein